jgi:hypothetical protein
MRVRNLSLDEAHASAVDVPDNEEHIPAWNRAKDFLKKNADQFGIGKD